MAHNDIFFFKQKTAYEMRISDWSSDVCSSDLAGSTRSRSIRRGRAGGLCTRPSSVAGDTITAQAGIGSLPLRIRCNTPSARLPPAESPPMMICERSEEHTSELQSLMRISYAVFCLKKKKIQPVNTNNRTTSL